MSLLKLIKQYMQANNIEENYTSAIPIEDNSISIELKDVNKAYKMYSEKNSAYIKPTINNISETSFIVVDRDGEEYKHFNKKDYDVKILDLVHPQKSNRYNSFVHIHNDTDVLSMVNSFFTFNINEIKPNSVFDMAERKLLTAFCFYVLDKYKEQPDKQNFTCINKILAKLHTTDDFDRFFNDFYKLNEEKPAYYYYKEARRCSSDSFKAVVISMGLRLSVFNIPQIADLTAADDFDIENLGNKKTAVFINIPTSDTFLNFIANMLIMQAFSLQQSVARNEKNIMCHSFLTNISMPITHD